MMQNYERLLESQRSMILGFEMRNSNLIRGRLDRLEASFEDVALEQAKLNVRQGPYSHFNASQGDSKFDAPGLFPSKMECSIEQIDKLSPSLESTSKDRQFETIKEVLVEMKNEQVLSQRQI